MVVGMVVACLNFQSCESSDGSQSDATFDHDDLGRARAALQADEVFASLLRDGEWSLGEPIPNHTERGVEGFGAIVTLGQTAESEGPWRESRCRSTVGHTFTFPYRDISELFVVFSQNGSEIRALRPGPSATFDDAAVSSPSSPPKCPSGFEDGEN